MTQCEFPFEYDGQIYEPLADVSAIPRGWIPPSQALPVCDGCGWAFWRRARQEGRGLVVMTLDRRRWCWLCPECLLLAPVRV